MRQRFTNKAVLFSVALALLSTGAAVADDQAGPTTIRVDCGQGQSLAQALASRARVLVVEFTGTCTGRVDVARSDVTLRGADASATVVGGPVVVEGQARVTFDNFTVRDTPPANIESTAGKGIEVNDSQHVSLSRLTLVNIGNFGIDINASTGDLSNTTVTRAANVGVALNRNAAFELAGTVKVTQGGFVGVIVSANAALEVEEEASLVTTDNGATGLQIELKGHVTLHSQLIADRNEVGINVVDQGGFIYGNGTIEAANNRVFGVQVGELADWTVVAGAVAGVRVVNNGGPGFSVLRNAFVRLVDGTIITGNGGPGLLVDGAAVAVRGSTISGNNNGQGDVVLNFGSLATFDRSNTLGTPLNCDGTSRARGQFQCS